MYNADLTQNWGVKHLHGLKWGIHINTTPDRRIKSAESGGAYARLLDQNLDNIPKHLDHLLIFGNIWANNQEKTVFHNPGVLRLIHGHRYVFWDNPALPHLLYKGPWNPEGYKNWCRMCWDWINPTTHTTPANSSGTERINQLLAASSNGEITHWHQITGSYPKDTVLGKRALLVPSSPEWHFYYQGMTVDQWIESKRRVLLQRGFSVEVRQKPSRRDREGRVGKLYQQLDGVGLVVTEGVSAIESILAGVPALVGEWAPAGPLATRWEDFVRENYIDTPTADRTEQWMERVLQDTFHKSEIYSGKWNA